MKKSYIIIASFFILMASMQFSLASTDISGEVYSEVFGVMTMEDNAHPYATTIDDISNPQIEDCDINTQTCLIKGFSWADVVGWTLWDGTELRTELGGNVSDFPDGHIAKATYNGNLGGFIWGEKYGWVQLSACAGIDNQVSCNAKSYCNWNSDHSPASCDINPEERIADIGVQTKDDWGAYIDFCPMESNSATCNAKSYCGWNAGDSICEFNGNASIGHPLKGNAWSEKLGWIKFGPDGGETEFTGAFTTWLPDLTPPELQITNPDNTWIPASLPSLAIEWPEFAKDNDSTVGIDITSSFINIKKDATSPDFDGCTVNDQIALISTSTIPGAINLSIPAIAEVGRPENGFCKYELSGVLYNSSGFGYYFGPDGQAQATSDWGGTTSIEPNIYEANPVTLFVRAGEFSDTKTEYNFSYSSTPAIADGTDTNELKFIPKDSAGNPIVDVTADIQGNTSVVEADWVRNISMNFDLGSGNIAYTFDSIDPFRNASQALKVNSVTRLFADNLNFPNVDGTPGNVPDTNGSYFLDTIAFAPTTVGGNTLILADIHLILDDKDIPAISPSTSNVYTSYNSTLDSTTNSLPYTYTFEPALQVTAGDLDTKFLIIGKQAKATFSIKNLSTNSNLTEYSLDHIHAFTGGEAALLEIKDIDVSTSSDGVAGRTDPNASSTRYQIFKTAGTIQTDTGNEFHTNELNYHSPSYNFENNIGNDGVYEVDGTSYTLSDDPCRGAGNCSAVSIDRNDPFTTVLNTGAGATNYSINLTPNQIIGQSLTNSTVKFGMDQYLAYTTPEITSAFGNLFNIYQIPRLIDDIEVKSIGLGTSGVISGEQVFETVGGRDLESITTTSSADLRKEIRRNVATLTRSITPCSPTTLASLSTTHGGCIAVDTKNKSVVAYYSGIGTVNLDNGTTTITVPNNYKYTIILDEGAELNIESNITYGNANSSLGIIVLGSGNVYIDPSPTNIVGLLYTEGSLLSSPDEGANLYYGAGANSNDLKNQLFWQGSIASKNTIGGAPNKIIPKGVSCSAWPDDAGNCAKAYDLDFIRRFTTITDSGETFAPAGYNYSGGGSCSTPETPSNRGCSSGSLPTTITLSSGAINSVTSKSLDTFFIERDNRPVPPGFSSSGGLTSSQEIR